jgi:hypothetical protein
MLHSPLSVSFHQCFTITFILLLLSSEEQTGETWST